VKTQLFSTKTHRGSWKPPGILGWADERERISCCCCWEIFLPRTKILEAYAKDTGTYLLRCYSKYHRAINTWESSRGEFLAHLDTRGWRHAQRLLIPGRERESLPFSRARESSAYGHAHLLLQPSPSTLKENRSWRRASRSSSGNVPGKATRGRWRRRRRAAPSPSPLRRLPTPLHGGSKRRLRPDRPGSSSKHILSLINSFEASRIRYLLASSALSPAPCSSRQGHLPAGKRRSLYYYLCRYGPGQRRGGSGARAGHTVSWAPAAGMVGAHASTHAAPAGKPGAQRRGGGCPRHRLLLQHAARRARCRTRCVPVIKPPLRAADSTKSSAFWST